MHAGKLLHSLLDMACKLVDDQILNILFTAAEMLIFCKQLLITSKCLSSKVGNK